MDTVMDEKYIVFKRGEFMDLISPQAMNMRTAEIRTEKLLDLALADAVVLRRQDLFAGPALHVYAHCISMVANFSDKKHLQAVADYFHEQAVLADAEGWKLPD